LFEARRQGSGIKRSLAMVILKYDATIAKS